MAARFRHPDLNAHEPGCLKIDGGEPVADGQIAYIDVFCDCHRYTEPKILTNGTDIAWPAGWGEDQAAEWRKRKGLVPPSELGSAEPGLLPQNPRLNGAAS
jgi:hypothetical protein